MGVEHITGWPEEDFHDRAFFDVDGTLFRNSLLIEHLEADQI